MNGAGWVSLISLCGWLILALSAFRAHRIGGRRMVAMALAWAAIFLFVAAVISALSV